jgi:hypothetical protein
MAYIFLGKRSKKNANFGGLKNRSPHATNRRGSKKANTNKIEFFSEKKHKNIFLPPPSPHTTPPQLPPAPSHGKGATRS